jgi:hypothetical protein
VLVLRACAESLESGSQLEAFSGSSGKKHGTKYQRFPDSDDQFADRIPWFILDPHLSSCYRKIML